MDRQDKKKDNYKGAERQSAIIFQRKT
uniref:Uncharacterized protein n=1 Tax=Anguilla anguilla TaxID=7936 RepID=A0A0E9QLA8_ANGAN